MPKHATDQHPHSGPGHCPLLSRDKGQSHTSLPVRAAGSLGGQHPLFADIFLPHFVHFSYVMIMVVFAIACFIFF